MTWNLKTLSVTGAVLILAAGFLVASKPKAPAPQISYITKTSDAEGVSVSVKPDLSGSRWKFEISLNTHSGSLDQNLGESSELRDDKGNMFRSSNWVGDSSGGHHRNGVLEFAPITPKPRAITLIIHGVGADRSFTWNLN